ncbi:MAG: PAS domain S-box protein [Limisphaerales bacterium]
MNKLAPEKNRRILVIDDNRAIHEDFRKILAPGTSTAAALDETETALFGKPAIVVQKIRYEIDSAYQGQDGVLLVQQALAAGRPYAMAFVDIRMPPGMDGVETTQKICAVDPEIQIVLCTAYADYSWDEMFEKIGNSDGVVILKKPFDIVEALQLAQALTEKWWLRRQSQRKMEALEGMVTARTKELQWKTAFLEAQVNSSIDGILVVDQQGLKILQNQRMNDLFKIPTAIVTDRDDEKQRWWVVDKIKDQEQFRAKIDHLNSHPQETSRDEIELMDGTTLDRYSAPVVGTDGINYGRIWTFRDITERKQAENVLRESDEKFHQLADNIDDVFWIRSPDMREVHYVSPAFERIWGRSVASLQASPLQWADFIHAEDRERVLNAFAELCEGAHSLEIEYRIMRPDDEIRWVHVRGFPVRDAAGLLIRNTGIVTDITERKRVEDELRESEARFSSAFEYAPIGMALVLPDDRFFKVNRTFCDLVGYTEDELLTRTFRDITHLEDLELSRENVRRLRAGEIQFFEMEKRYRHRGGQLITALSTVSLIRDRQGLPVYVIAQIQDITGRKQLEARMLQSQKMETVGKLAGGIAHEFNSILTAIIGQCELLLADLPPGSPLKTNATEISKSAGRAATLTRQLLAYGRKQFLQPEPLDLNQVVAGMDSMFHNLMGGGVDVRIVPAPGLHLVKADAGQIEQVIINMAMNAHDAMPVGGKLMLETANVSLGEEYVSCFPESEIKAGEYVMLAITDTGAGMTAEVKARVFEPFFSTKGVGQGTGLGLSTCYGIIKQSGGHISVYSEPGRGTTFKIYLPQVESQVKVPIQRLDAPDLPRGTETILLVEDDPALRDMAATLLRRLGYTVLTAANGIEALSLKHERGPGHIDLLFTDVVMPHMSGTELADRVRASYPHTKILFTSAYTENAIIHQGVLDKGVALLQKPFTPSTLAHRLRDVLDQPK